ncbi:hypothetical protein BU17DRAFT_70051 [Hysterangium stoloniferum]|nr:hypothetical protein BU17DRAFT_70051 [Hysterangium stoloniferum]
MLLARPAPPIFHINTHENEIWFGWMLGVAMNAFRYHLTSSSRYLRYGEFPKSKASTNAAHFPDSVIVNAVWRTERIARSYTQIGYRKRRGTKPLPQAGRSRFKRNTDAEWEDHTTSGVGAEPGHTAKGRTRPDSDNGGADIGLAQEHQPPGSYPQNSGTGPGPGEEYRDSVVLLSPVTRRASSPVHEQAYQVGYRCLLYRCPHKDKDTGQRGDRGIRISIVSPIPLDCK